jgi:hypothetical protein
MAHPDILSTGQILRDAGRRSKAPRTKQEEMERVGRRLWPLLHATFCAVSACAKTILSRTVCLGAGRLECRRARPPMVLVSKEDRSSSLYRPLAHKKVQGVAPDQLTRGRFGREAGMDRGGAGSVREAKGCREEGSMRTHLPGHALHARLASLTPPNRAKPKSPPVQRTICMNRRRLRLCPSVGASRKARRFLYSEHPGVRWGCESVSGKA